MKKIKVLIVAGTMNSGGVENQLMHLIRNSDKNKIQIDFTSTIEDGFYRSEIECLGGKYILIPLMSWKNPGVYCKALIKVMKDGQYDIVHTNELFHSGIVAWAAHKANVKSCFVHSHSTSDSRGMNDRRSCIRKIYNTVMRSAILRYSDVQIGCSALAGEFLFGKKAISKKSYHVMYNSVDCEKYIQNYDVKETGEFCDEWLNIVHVGRVYEVKNQRFIVEIAEEFKRRKLKVRFLCAGEAFDNEYMNAIKDRIEKDELQDYVYMLGNRDDIDVLLRKASAFILPSVYEGMPLALIEAQAAGLNCVVADTFSREVDLELGNIVWMDNITDVMSWTDEIENAISRGKPVEEDVVKALAEKKMDSKEFARNMCELYVKTIEGSL